MQQEYDESLHLADSAQEGMPNYLREEKITAQDIYNHMLGPGVSLALHVVVLIIAGTVVMSTNAPVQKELVIETVQVDVKPIPPPPPPPPPPEEEQIIDQPSDNPSDRPAVSTEVAAVNVENVTVQGTSSVDDVMPNTMAVKVSNSALRLPGIYAARTAGGRKGALGRHGGTARGNNAVNKALKWLAKVQNEDGSWGDPSNKKDNGAALTAVATLTFLSHGETPQSAEYGDTILRALKRLCQYVDTMPNDGACIQESGNGYAHAMVAYAVSEGYAMTKIPMLERSMNKIVYSLVNGQNNLGGYDYMLRKDRMVNPLNGGAVSGASEPRCDLSVGGWNYQALKAAFTAGSTVPGLEDAVNKAVKCIETVNRGGSGGFTYANSNGKGPATESMTSVGTLCLQLLGAGSNKAAKDGLKWIEEYKCIPGDEKSTLTMDWKNPPSKTQMPLYTWYYMTQAIFQGTGGTGRTWKKWNNSFQSTLIKEQNAEGYWESPTDKYGTGGPNEGCAAPKRQANAKGQMVDVGGGKWTPLGSKVWATSMCCLMLQVYYRFLPSYKLQAPAPETGSANPAGGESDSLLLD